VDRALITPVRSGWTAHEQPGSATTSFAEPTTISDHRCPLPFGICQQMWRPCRRRLAYLWALDPLLIPLPGISTTKAGHRQHRSPDLRTPIGRHRRTDHHPARRLPATLSPTQRTGGRSALMQTPTTHAVAARAARGQLRRLAAAVPANGDTRPSPGRVYVHPRPRQPVTAYASRLRLTGGDHCDGKGRLHVVHLG
jgi:hypothetical protein